MKGPLYSPRMLKSFLRLGGDYRWFSHPKSAGRAATIERYRKDIRRLARVSEQQFDDAWEGRLKDAEPRVKLWGALGVHCADNGVRLLDSGCQEAISNG